MKFLLGLLIAISPFSGALADSRKVDFTTPIFIDGKPAIDDFKCPLDKDGRRSCDAPYTVGEIAYYSLERPSPNQNWAEAIKRDDLARAVRNAKDFSLLPEQVTMIESAMGPLWSPAILGSVKAIIDP